MIELSVVVSDSWSTAVGATSGSGVGAALGLVSAWRAVSGAGPEVAPAVAGLVAGAVVAWPGRGSGRARRRLGRLHRAWSSPGRSVHAAAAPAGAVRGRVPAAVGAGLAAGMLVGLPWGAVVAALVVVALVVVLGRLEPAAVRQRRDRTAADFPVAVDLLAACLRAGATTAAAAEAVAAALGGPVAEALRGVAALLRLGGDPVRSWASLETDETLAPLARAVGRAAASGAPLATALDQIARDGRDDRRAAAEERARKVGVRAAAPLGLCFLPAFVVLGVVPVVAGVAQDLRLW